MQTITTYQQAYPGAKNPLNQDELQAMAKKIASSCKLINVFHHTYSTNAKPQSQDGEFVTIENGSMALTYDSEYLPLRYSVHVDCGIVTEIIEIINN